MHVHIPPPFLSPPLSFSLSLTCCPAHKEKPIYHLLPPKEKPSTPTSCRPSSPVQDAHRRLCTTCATNSRRSTGPAPRRHLPPAKCAVAAAHDGDHLPRSQQPRAPVHGFKTQPCPPSFSSSLLPSSSSAAPLSRTQLSLGDWTSSSSPPELPPSSSAFSSSSASFLSLRLPSVLSTSLQSAAGTPPPAVVGGQPIVDTRLCASVGHPGRPSSTESATTVPPKFSFSPPHPCLPSLPSLHKSTTLAGTTPVRVHSVRALRLPVSLFP